MEIRIAQEQAYKLTQDHAKINNIEHNKEATFFHLVEEIGEISREIYNDKSKWRDELNKENFKEEVADVLIQLLIFSEENNINLDSAFQDKILKLRKRFELD